MSNENSKIANIQMQIKDLLKLDMENLIFEYDNTGLRYNMRLNLITFNPRHKQSFLYHD